MTEKPELYFERPEAWWDWLLQHHDKTPQGVYLIFYKLDTKIPSMRWEEAVQMALCFGWIDSTVKSLGQGKRQQYFCPRRAKSPWSALNKKHIKTLEAQNLIHESGWKVINQAKQDGSWHAMDAVEKRIIPPDLKQAFKAQPEAFKNYKKFAPGYQKGYLSWLHQAKRNTTRQQRIEAIILFCKQNKKSRT